MGQQSHLAHHAADLGRALCVSAVAAPHLIVESTTYAINTAQMISYRDKAAYREALVAAKKWQAQQQKEAQPDGTGAAAGGQEAAQVIEPLLATAGDVQQQQGQGQEAASGQQQQQAVVQQQGVAGGVTEELAPGVVRSLSEVEPLPPEDPLLKVRRCLGTAKQ
jgi:hypothetical protein